VAISRSSVAVRVAMNDITVAIGIGQAIGNDGSADQWVVRSSRNANKYFFHYRESDNVSYARGAL
jgi:hypothetical protein